MDTPLVSCICITRPDREWCLPLAVACFQRQTYPAKELIVYSTGKLSEVSERLMNSDDRIVYQHTTDSMTLGSKRNRACQIAQGEFLAPWDDDDWHSPDRLSQLVSACYGADIAGTPRMIFHDWSDGRSWLYRYHGRRRYVCAASAVFRRSLWGATPYPDRPGKGEDTRFMWEACRLGKIALLSDAYRLYVAFRHGRNTETRIRLRPPKFTPHPHIHAVMGQDFDQYVAAYQALNKL